MKEKTIDSTLEITWPSLLASMIVKINPANPTNVTMVSPQEGRLLGWMILKATNTCWPNTITRGWLVTKRREWARDVWSKDLDILGNRYQLLLFFLTYLILLLLLLRGGWANSWRESLSKLLDRWMGGLIYCYYDCTISKFQSGKPNKSHFQLISAKLSYLSFSEGYRYCLNYYY